MIEKDSMNSLRLSQKLYNFQLNTNLICGANKWDLLYIVLLLNYPLNAFFKPLNIPIPYFFPLLILMAL